MAANRLRERGPSTFSGVGAPNVEPRRPIRLTLRRRILYSAVDSQQSAKRNRRESDRAMNYQNRFAFTYRFPFWGKRAGESRAKNQS